MKWEKKGLIFVPDGKLAWSKTHAQVPVVDIVDKNIWRIYYATRNTNNISNTSYLEVEASNPNKILYVHDKPILPLGHLGTFDEHGIMPSCIINVDNKKYLYYIGWNAGGNIGYRLAIGLAISQDGGKSFNKFSEGPIMDRSVYDFCLCASPFVLYEKHIWKMWYISGTSWEKIKGKAEPFYHIKYAFSFDGIEWKRTGEVCIDYDEFTQGISRPCVINEDGIYKMFYSYRNNLDYRFDVKNSYRIGYAESKNGLNWHRLDKTVGIERSSSGWDSEMMAYPFIICDNNQKFMFYNGNGFGKSGFGYSIIK